MSKMKKIVGLVLAVVMVAAMSVVALADDTYTITIAYDQTGHTYEAYQIFSGDLQYAYTVYTGTTDPGETVYTYDTTTGTYTATTWDGTTGYTYYLLDSSVTSPVLSNIKWGTGIIDTDEDYSDELLDALKADNTVVGQDSNSQDIEFSDLFANCTTAADVADVLENYNTNDTVAETFAQIVSEYLTNTTKESTKSSAKDSDGNYIYTISGLSAGYYLIKDQDGSVSGDDSYTDIILEVVANIKVGAKADTPTLDKTITTTETDQSGTGHVDDTTADYDIGDDVPFTLTATLPSTYANYDIYRLIFHDTLSTGLTFNESSVVVTVYADENDTTGTVVKSGYTVVTYSYVEATGLTEFASGTTYYTKNASNVYTEVAANAQFDSTETYYVRNCYHYEVKEITQFDSNTTYYTYDAANGTYEEVDQQTATFDENTTYYVKVQANCSFEVQIADTNKLYSDDAGSNLITVTEDSIIVVTYTAKLNDGAANIETNAAYIEFSNNPNNSGSGTGTTPEDLTTVFTFTMDVNKVDESGYPLEGAGFTLYKKADITEFESGVTYYTYTNGTMTEVASVATFDSSETYYVVVGNGEKTAAYQYQKVDITDFKSGVTYSPVTGTDYYVYAMNDFVFNGLAVGTYILVETTVPSGYNALEDFVFSVIIAKTVEDENGNASVSELAIKDEKGNTISSETPGEETFTVSSDKLTISTDVENKSGSELPSTGGIGTTIFYVVGGILVVGAVVLLITRKRMSSAK